MLQLGKQLEAEGYRLRYTSNKRSQWWRMLDMLWTVVSNARRTDLVLLDTYGTLNFYYALLVSQWCRMLKLPYICILHGGTLPKRLAHHKRKSDLIFKHARLLVSPSLYFMEVFKEYGYTNTRFIPNTIEIGNYPFLSHSSSGGQAPSSSYAEALADRHSQREGNIGRYNTMNLLWVRSFAKIYNPSLAVQLLHHLQAKGHNARLTMVGPDSDGSLKAVQALAKDLKVEVTFTGKLSKPEWIALAKDHNIFINTTNFDNMPVSVIEAMALGLPVVSTHVGGLPYLIKHEVDGLLVPANDVVAMADAVLRLQADPDFANSLAVKARERAEGFDWAVVRERWLEVLGS